MSDLHNIFSSSNCLHKMQLINYIQHKLDRDEEYLVETHLNDCPFCCDALEGLMESDLVVMEHTLKEIKPLLIQKQIASIPIEKKVVEISPLKIEKKKNYRWLVAASVLLLFGLGGFSVYSYIHSQNSSLAMKEDGKSVSTGSEYTTAAASENAEIVQLKVPEDSLKMLDSKNETKEESNTEKPTAKFAPPIISKSVEKSKRILDEKKITPKAETIIETQEYHTKYADKVVKQEKSKSIEPLAEQKSSTIGMSKNSNAPQVVSQSANQLNYPSTNNIENNKDFSNQELTKTDYETGLNYYNEKDYKSAIIYFEKALKKSSKKNNDEIIYHLAQAYYKVGEIEKAETILKELSENYIYRNPSKK